MTAMTELTLLAIESSCDETGAAVMRVRYDDTDTSTPAIPEVEVLADVVASSMEQHARFGGVVPEIASRAHLEALQPVVSEARAQAAAKLGIDTFIPDAVAATVGPGLAGALLVGSAGAKAYAAAWQPERHTTRFRGCLGWVTRAARLSISWLSREIARPSRFLAP